MEERRGRLPASGGASVGSAGGDGGGASGGRSDAFRKRNDGRGCSSCWLIRVNLQRLAPDEKSGIPASPQFYDDVMDFHPQNRPGRAGFASQAQFHDRDCSRANCAITAS
jgi:hypothetical protein